MEIYLDNSATTRPCEAAVEAVCTSMRSGFYNPSALYGKAFEEEKRLMEARRIIASAVGGNEKNVLFTSGGTESDNLAIFGLTQPVHEKGDILYTAAEHAAVKNSCEAAAKRYGVQARAIPLDGNGSVDLEALAGMLSEKTMLICVMQVCNETGVIMPLKEISKLRDNLAPQAMIHVDGVQGFMRVPFSMKEAGVQSYALSGHKIHAPKGIGALVLADGVRLLPQIEGGGQQNNLRSGTENTCGIEGLAAAVRAYPADGYSRMKQMKERLVSLLRESFSDLQVNGFSPEDERSAGHILNVSFPPVRAETLLHALEAQGVIIGTGSACSSKKGKHSTVLTAMGLAPKRMEAAVRISLCPDNTMKEMELAAKAIISCVNMLKPFTRR